MAADCCGGPWDLFLNSYIHRMGCPKSQVGSNQQFAEKRMEEGEDDAFRPARSSDPSYKLGKKREEEKRVEHIVNNVYGFPVGGRRRRGPLL